MNYINAKISDIKSRDSLNIVSFQAGEILLKMMSLELEENVQKDSSVILGVKSTNVALMKGSGEHLSISNQLPCVISSLQMGELLCKVSLKGSGFELDSIITKDSALRLNLCLQDEVLALIKSNELSIAQVL